jgi:hypothetical protein
MGNLIRLPLPVPRVREDGGLWEEEPRAAGLIGLPPRRMRSWVRRCTAIMSFGSPPRPCWSRDDRSLSAATNALLADRSPRGVNLSPGDANALRAAIALRSLHPGGGAPTPNYVDDTARQLRTMQRTNRDEPHAPDLDEANGRGNSYPSNDGQLRVRVGS